jgi:hypothetical protein
MPFAGDLFRAKIYLLPLNPGFRPLDYKAEEDDHYRRALIATRKQQLQTFEFPFVFLDPQLAWTGGFSWWFGKLGDVAREVAKQRYNGEVLPAVKLLSPNLAVLQAFPYHSKSFGAGGVIQKLPSFIAAKEFVNSRLVPRAESGKILSPGLRGGRAIVERLMNS